MKKFALLFIPFLFIPGPADLGAQAQEKTGIPLVMAGVLHVLEYVDGDEGEAGGATFDHALSWEKAPDSPDTYRFTFSDFLYTYLRDEASLYGEKDKYCRVVLNGTLTCGASGRLNGRLSVGGETGLSALSFDNLSAWESSETGGITADGVSYTQAEITEIIENADYDFDPARVLPWEMECIYAGLASFVKSAGLTWEDGTGVLDSLIDDPHPEGVRTGSADGKIFALAKKDGIELVYKDFPIDSDGEYFLFTVTGNVFISVKRQGGQRDIDSMTLNGSVEAKGLPAFSRAELKDFTLRETEEDNVMRGSGAVVIDAKEYQGAQIVNSMRRLFQ
jgi:hypothetical protein